MAFTQFKIYGNNTSFIDNVSVCIMAWLNNDLR